MDRIPKGNTVYFKTCKNLIEEGSVYTIEPIFGELLQGVLNQREMDTIVAYYENIPKIAVNNLFIVAGKYSHTHRLTNKGIGIMDAAIIVATMESNSLLWTLDKKISSYLDAQYAFSN
jgi:hypothetical protein